jgi:hypothetical protein
MWTKLLTLFRKKQKMVPATALKDAFLEGWQMHSETSRMRCVREHALLKQDLDKTIEETRVWRSAEEAWANSEAEELLN